MAAGMAIWMRYRCCGWTPSPPGPCPGSLHVVTLPLMLVVMLWRRSQNTS
jgi:hypothetical protein